MKTKTEPNPAPQQALKNFVSTGTETEMGYRVEARDSIFNPGFPIRLQDGIAGPEWREITFSETNNPAGIPHSPFGYKHHHALLTYYGATALAWTVIAQVDDPRLELRIVQYRLVTTHTLEKCGALLQDVIRWNAKHHVGA